MGLASFRGCVLVASYDSKKKINFLSETLAQVNKRFYICIVIEMITKLKPKKMTNSVITRTLNKIKTFDQDLGAKHDIWFKRYSVLPTRVVRALQWSIYLEENDLDVVPHIKTFFGEMTEEEYINYLRSV